MKNHNLFISFLERVPLISWRRVLESTGVLKGLLLKIPLILTGSLTKENALSVTSFVSSVRRIRRGSGFLFLAMYLKYCSVALMQHYGVLDPSGLGSSVSYPVSVSRTRSGLPRIIPKIHRRIIRSRVQRSDFLVQWYLSLFSVSKIIKLAKPIGKQLFSSITDQPKDIDKVQCFLGEMKGLFPKFSKMYVPWLSTIPLHKGLVWMPSWKSLPNSHRQMEEGVRVPPNPFSYMKWEVLFRE